MALKKCKECGKDVSTEAQKCPNCGAPVKRSRSFGCFTLISILFLLGLISSLFDNDKSVAPSKSKPIAQKTQEEINNANIRRESLNIDEKKLLLNSFFGDFSYANKLNKNGKLSLEVWAPYVQYCETLSSMFYSAMCAGVTKLSVDYDSVWIIKDPDDDDTTKLYWKDNQVQACTIEKIYEGNPYTKKRLSKPMHKITNIYDRDYILLHHTD